MEPMGTHPAAGAHSPGGLIIPSREGRAFCVRVGAGKDVLAQFQKLAWPMRFDAVGYAEEGAKRALKLTRRSVIIAARLSEALDRLNPNAAV